MAYDSTKPAGTDPLGSSDELIRENLRALKDDKIVNALKLSDYFAGNASGNIPISNGTLNTNLNAEKLGGLTLAAINASIAAILGGLILGNASGNIPISNGTLNTNLNAEKLGGLTLAAILSNITAKLDKSGGTINGNLYVNAGTAYSHIVNMRTGSDGHIYKTYILNDVNSDSTLTPCLLGQIDDTTMGYIGINMANGQPICKYGGVQYDLLHKGNHNDVGSIAGFLRSTAPAGYLKGQLALVSKTTYSDLYNTIGDIGAIDHNNIPILTANSSNGFTITASTEAEPAYEAFDRNFTVTRWRASTSTGSIKCHKDSGTMKIYGYSVTGNYEPALLTRSPKSWTVKDGAGNVLQTKTNEINWYPSETRYYYFDTPVTTNELFFDAISAQSGADFLTIMEIEIFGIDTGSTSFYIPELRSEFLRGLDDGRGIDAGRVLGSFQPDAFQGHQFNYTNPRIGTGNHVDGNSGVSSNENPTVNGGTTAGPVTDGVNGYPRVASETRPRNKAVLWCIKY